MHHVLIMGRGGQSRFYESRLLDSFSTTKALSEFDQVTHKSCIDFEVFLLVPNSENSVFSQYKFFIYFGNFCHYRTTTFFLILIYLFFGLCLVPPGFSF